MTKQIIFDIGYVLIDWNPDFVYLPYFKSQQKMQDFYNETGIFKLNAELDKGLPFNEGLTDLANQFPHYQEPIKFWQHKWTEMIGGLVEDSIRILKRLHEMNYPLYGLTNWSAETFPYVLNKYDFFRVFRDIVISGEEKVIKPYPEIYQILLSRNNLLAQHCLFIDDNIENLLGAEKLGIQTIKFENSKQLEKDLRLMGIQL